MSKRRRLTTETFDQTLHRIDVTLRAEIKKGLDVRKRKHKTFCYYEEEIYKLLVDIYYKKLVLQDLAVAIERAKERGDIE